MVIKLKVLHISEAYGGGVTSAIKSYVEHSSEFEHYLFATRRKNDSTGEEKSAVFKDIFFVERNLKAIKLLRAIIKSLNPDVIHIHSTYAGAICRLLPFIPRKKTIYTPHGYAFLRDDHSLLLQIFYSVEKLLSKRSMLIAGCGQHEKNIASSFIGEENTVELVNVCGELPDVKPIYSDTTLPTIGMTGRISNQKGFDFFLATSKALQGKAHFKWIGGGDLKRESLLREAGIEVTGWMDRAKVISHLSGLDLYFHTAAWEGFPISVLEASRLEKPILLRTIAPFEAELLPTVGNVQDAITQLNSWLNNEEIIVKQCANISHKINQYHSPDRLRHSLNSLYLKIKSISLN